ncbi:ABC transporter substrate-binding protein [Agrobacterium tumefaciens]|uniref:ABC transporter substrate-binding protein n=1 Tax=Agrobacterium tumefaciens TaxID=358 RepID=A0AA44J9P1_AGRTU|nr:ABC transporter substrate-binding protein [Agrobacterium tumefaciens]NSL21220.1 ABC transporter substrate-binding protein [Agrobacterium tumefaciens]NTB83792.1 ABC transporter substrate-binding protein [Agrobacterium tumefaciens]NTC20739.1 ABC transporter substrate-binding protein [Agrobacterium tumefaciens]NTC29263.1 ABC transporter substrate-binding protein [Agrobacterium tumefaciens]NTC57759.1 ABC transporter substrate-binding protein [Agrobacterium tumefaciens]
MTSTQELSLAGGAQGFNWLPVFVAEEHGIFAKHGLSIQYKKMGTVDKATSAVLEGEADLAITPPEGAVSNFLQGGELRAIASNSNRLPMSIVARPSIKSVKDLKGKKVGTSSLTEGTAIYTQLVLAKEGLKYPGDYEFELAGIHTKRWEALQTGEIDCAPQPAPWNFLAEQEGYNLIGEINDVIPEIVFAAVVGKRTWLEANRNVVIRFLQALLEAYAITNDPSKENVTLPIFQRVTTKDDAELALRGLRYMRDMGMWPIDLSIPERALATTVDLMIRANLLDELARATAVGVFDPVYLEAALAHNR